jgi:hypothetical protein
MYEDSEESVRSYDVGGQDVLLLLSHSSLLPPLIIKGSHIIIFHICQYRMILHVSDAFVDTGLVSVKPIVIKSIEL